MEVRATPPGQRQARLRNVGDGLALDSKIAIILQAGAETHEGLARALHSILYARELRENGASVRLVFDGAGSEWAAKLHAPESPPEKRLSALFNELTKAGVVYEVCDYCSGAFHGKDILKEAGAPLSNQYMDHPSIAALGATGIRSWLSELAPNRPQGPSLAPGA